MIGFSEKHWKQRKEVMVGSLCGNVFAISRGRRGLVPTRTAVVRDESGDVCITSEAQNERWRRHFTKILNVQSEFDMEELSKGR